MNLADSHTEKIADPHKRQHGDGHQADVQGHNAAGLGHEEPRGEYHKARNEDEEQGHAGVNAQLAQPEGVAHRGDFAAVWALGQSLVDHVEEKVLVAVAAEHPHRAGLVTLLVQGILTAGAARYRYNPFARDTESRQKCDTSNMDNY